MPNKEQETKIAGRDGAGNEIAASVKTRSFDAPILPAAEMELFSKFLPEANKIILEQTVKEAEWRRKEVSDENLRIYRERKLGQTFGFFIGIGGIIGGSCTAIYGSAWAGGAIASAAVVTLAGAFLTSAKSTKEK